MRGLLVLCACLLAHHAWADGLRTCAAGSLTAPFTAMVQAFGAAADEIGPPVFGPSGMLRQRIEHGDAVDVFASGAEAGHPLHHIQHDMA